MYVCENACMYACIMYIYVYVRTVCMSVCIYNTYVYIMHTYYVCMYNVNMSHE